MKHLYSLTVIVVDSLIDSEINLFELRCLQIYLHSSIKTDLSN